MKQQFRVLLMLSVICSVLMTDCNRTSTGVTVNVTGVNPRNGNTGTFVTITGTGFNPNPAIDSVSFGLIAGKVIAASSTQIVVTVPMNPDSAKLDSVLILVGIQGALLGSGFFTYDMNGSTGPVSSFAGSGASGASDNTTGVDATFANPENGAFDRYGNLFVADYGNNEIRKITPAGVVTTFAGNTTAGFVNAKGKSASFSSPSGLVFDTQGNLYVSDELNNAIRKIDTLGNVTTFAGNGDIGFGNGIGTAARFQRPIGIGIDTLGGNLYVADSRNNMIRQINLSTAMVTTMIGQIGYGSTDGDSSVATFSSPRGIAVHGTGGGIVYVFVADYGNNKIREVVAVGSAVKSFTVAGNSNNDEGFTNTPITFNGPNSLAIGTAKDGVTAELFIADASNHAIRYDPTFDPSSTTALSSMATLAGTGIPGLKNGSYTSAQFDFPDGVAFNPKDGNLYVIEFGNNDIRKIVLQ